jgi:6-pyruvoyltetrahydropterin/6-carboxytetrahydropterin synthase
MKARIAKEFRWEMSHRLPYHSGLCKNIHGHSYKMKLELEGESDSRGMILDYYDIEAIMKPIIENLDHSFICDSHDTLMNEFLEANNFKFQILPCFTTAENIALHLLNILIPEFKRYNNLSRIAVRLYETEDVFAEVESFLNK